MKKCSNDYMCICLRQDRARPVAARDVPSGDMV